MTQTQTVDPNGRTVAARPQTLDDETLASIHSYEDAILALQNAGMAPTVITEYGTGFEVLEDKRQLVKVPFFIIDWRFSEGDHGPFVSLRIVTKDGRKLIVNDGSSGIRDQMVKISEDRLEKFGGDITKAHAGLICPKGLRASDYTYDDDGKEKPATTYYIAI